MVCTILYDAIVKYYLILSYSTIPSYSQVSTVEKKKKKKGHGYSVGLTCGMYSSTYFVLSHNVLHSVLCREYNVPYLLVEEMAILLALYTTSCDNTRYPIERPKPTKILKTCIRCLTSPPSATYSPLLNCNGGSNTSTCPNPASESASPTSKSASSVSEPVSPASKSASVSSPGL